MSVFVDTGVFYAAFDRTASRHETARGALESVLRSAEYGKVVTSEYVYDETVTLTLRRTRRTADAIALGRRIRAMEDGSSPTGPTILFSSRSSFDLAIETFERFEDHSLSFTDAMTIAMVDHHGLDAVLSFDDDFDGIVERIEPGSLEP